MFNFDRWFIFDVVRLEKYFVFWGFGYVLCFGQNFVKIEFSKICVILVRDYDFVQVDKVKEWRWKVYFIVVLKDWFCYVVRRE